MSKVKLAFAANEWKDGDGAEASVGWIENPTKLYISR